MVAIRSGGPGILEASALLFALIHRSAWKRNSRNFALTEFYEVRLTRFLGGSQHLASPKQPQTSLIWGGGGLRLVLR